MDAMKRQLERNSLRGTIMRDIFCKRCDGVLDVRNSVEVSAWKDGQCLLVRALHGKCWDEMADKLRENLKGHVDSVDVIDGRGMKWR